MAQFRDLRDVFVLVHNVAHFYGVFNAYFFLQVKITKTFDSLCAYSFHIYVDLVNNVTISYIYKKPLFSAITYHSLGNTPREIIYVITKIGEYITKVYVNAILKLRVRELTIGVVCFWCDFALLFLLFSALMYSCRIVNYLRIVSTASMLVVSWRTEVVRWLARLQLFLTESSFCAVEQYPIQLRPLLLTSLMVFICPHSRGAGMPTD